MEGGIDMVPANVQNQIKDFMAGEVTAEEFATFLEAHPNSVGEMLEKEIYPYFLEAFGQEVEDFDIDNINISQVFFDENSGYIGISGMATGTLEPMDPGMMGVGVDVNFDIDISPTNFETLVDLEATSFRK